MEMAWRIISYLILTVIFLLGMAIVFHPDLRRSFPFGAKVRILVGTIIMVYALVRIWMVRRRGRHGSLVKRVLNGD